MKSSNIPSNDRLQGGKSMSIMNTQQTNKEKSDHSSNQRNLSAAIDSNRSSSSFVNSPIPASVSSNMTTTSGSTNSSNSTNTSSATTGSTVDSANANSQIPSTNAGNTALSA